ncbi:MAG TPA: hypothetical protein VN668_16445 [Stellaceae bacterium]|nr:hypothetical protein [Stellaceae bacterium]
MRMKNNPGIRRVVELKGRSSSQHSMRSSPLFLARVMTLGGVAPRAGGLPHRGETAGCARAFLHVPTGHRRAPGMSGIMSNRLVEIAAFPTRMRRQCTTGDTMREPDDLRDSREVRSLEFRKLTATEAEHLIAATWHAAEAGACASPGVIIHSEDGFLRVSLTFRTSEECALVREAVFALWSSRKEPSEQRFVLAPGAPRSALRPSEGAGMCAEKDLAAPLGPELRERVSTAMEAFDAAFSEAARNPNEQTIDHLAATADKLMRAVARVVIEARRFME